MPTPRIYGKMPAAFSLRRPYSTYKSPFGPQYKTVPNFHGVTTGTVVKYGSILGGFGGVAGIFVVFFFAEIPRFRDDVIKKVPVLSDFFNNEIAPEDNPF